MTEYRGRIAPSPTGFLHIGHAMTFWRAQKRHAKPVAGWCCGSKIWITIGAAENLPKRSLRICAGSGLIGMKARTSADLSRLTFKARGVPAIWSPGRNCWSAALSIRANARARMWRKLRSPRTMKMRNRFILAPVARDHSYRSYLPLML
jgi:hypothetical protein